MTVSRSLLLQRAALLELQSAPTGTRLEAVQVAPLWHRYLTKRDELRTKRRSTTDLDEFAWLIEELRVQTFAPELKTAVPVSLQRLQDLWAIVSRG